MCCSGARPVLVLAAGCAPHQMPDGALPQVQGAYPLGHAATNTACEEPFARSPLLGQASLLPFGEKASLREHAERGSLLHRIPKASP